MTAPVDVHSSVNILLGGLSAYAPVLFILAIAGGVGAGMLIIGWLSFRPNKPTSLKLMAYECGIEPQDNALERVFPRYYIYAMLFLAFDVEILFLIPWAIVFDRLGVFAFIEMVLFILVLLVGLLYAWAKGALDWHY